jgi:ferredoxin
MSDWVIDKSAVQDFLDVLHDTYQIYAPVQREGILCLDVMQNGEQVTLDYYNARQAPKEVFFPRSETLFTYEEDRIASASEPRGQRVVFGIRPCDARAAVLLDKVFDTPDYLDPYYVGRRQNTILVGLACNTFLSTCFCTAVGGGPFSTDGLDALWTDLGSRYLVETLTRRGETLVANSAHFRPATAEDRSLKDEIAARAEQAISGPQVKGIKEKLDTMYDDPFWDEVHLKCLGCGICTYLCPTCHCFDIADEGNAVQGRRVRNWDTCQFALFTHHTSGHNPRPSGRERMRQRMMHKFNYFVVNHQEIACVGCGRCVRQCPVNLDIRTVIDTIESIEVG